MAWYAWRPYVSGRGAAPERGARDRPRSAEQGGRLAPVTIDGRAIAQSFWGKAWCDNLERYTRLANRLPRGRTYVRNGSVMHLQLGPGNRSTALVERKRALPGVRHRSRPWPSAGGAPWSATARAGSAPLVELLREVLTRGHADPDPPERRALPARPGRSPSSAPAPTTRCCASTSRRPSTASARDSTLEPELFFRLRSVDQLDLISAAGRASLPTRGRGTRKRIADAALAEVFGIELDVTSPVPASPCRAGRRAAAPLGSARPQRARHD